MIDTTSVLRGKRILTTRPQHQFQGWCQRLQDAGAMVDNIPMLAIEAIASGPQYRAIKSQVLDFDQIEHAIFVSQNAVRIGFAWLQDYWPQMPIGPRFYAIGAATARAVEDCGVQCESAGRSMDSEALLALPTLQQVDGQRILIFRGCGGRTAIGDTLRERGGRVDYCELYRRTLPDDAAARLRAYTARPDAITVHSGETLSNLSQCLEITGLADLRQVPLLCPSTRVASQARTLGFPLAAAAENAGDAAMSLALAQLLASN